MSLSLFVCLFDSFVYAPYNFFTDNLRSFTGHYVVICGYDTDADEFEIRDPASSRYYIFSFSFLKTSPTVLFTMEKDFFFL